MIRPLIGAIAIALAAARFIGNTSAAMGPVDEPSMDSGTVPTGDTRTFGEAADTVLVGENKASALPAPGTTVHAVSAAPTIPVNTWTLLSPAGDPNAIVGRALVWDGVCTGGGSFIPCNRSWAGSAWNPTRRKLAVYGGAVLGGCNGESSYQCGYQNDLWEYDFSANAWTQYDATARGLDWEKGTDNVSMDFEATSGKMFALGFTGRSSSWQFAYYDDATRAMIPVTAANWPGAGGPVYDAAFACGDGKCVAFSGEPAYNSDPGQRTSIFDPAANGGAGSWTYYQSTCPGAQPVTSCTYGGLPVPTPRMQCQKCMVFDSDRHKFILFGGQKQTGSESSNDTWEYDVPTNRWTQITPAHAPPARKKQMMVYLAGQKKVLLYGGQGASGSSACSNTTVFTDTWIYDPWANPPDWTQLPSHTGDPCRMLAAIAYDTTNNVVLLFSGDNGEGAVSGTYALRYQPSGGPSNPPSAPLGLSATAVSATEVSLAWTDNSSDESGFRIERKTGASGIWGEIATVGTSVTTYRDLGVAAATTYVYRVRSYNGAGNSIYSNDASVTTPPAATNPPPPPARLTVR